MRVVLAILLTAGFALSAMPGRAIAQPDDEVNAAAVIVDSDGDTGYVYLFDSPEAPGAVCSIQPITGRLLINVSPINVHRSANGPDAQLVVMWIDAFEVNGDQYTLLNTIDDAVRTNATTGIAQFGGSGGYTIDAGYAGNVVIRVEVSWSDDEDEESGWSIIRIEHHDNRPIGGDISSSCQNATLNPSPTAISGAFAIGDMVRTTAGLNLRTGPGTTYPSLGVIPSNTTGVVEGFPVIAGGFTWYPVQFPSRPLGFVAGTWLTRLPNTPTPTATATQTHTPTATATATLTATATNTPADTATATSTATHTPTPQMSPAVTATPTFTATATFTSTPSLTPTVTLTPSRTPTRTPTTIPGGFAPGDHVRTTVNANIRSGPGTNFSIIGTAPNGRAGVVTGFPTAANGFTWYPVQMNGFAAGYVAGSLLTKYTPTATATPPASATATRTPTQSPTPGPSATPTITRTSTPTVIPGGFQPGDQVRTTGNVNLRSQPGTNQAVLATVPANTTGTITGFPIPANGFNWYQVQMNGYPAGFMAGDFLVRTSVAPTATAVPGGFRPGDPVHVAVNVLNLRSAAGTSAPVIGQMPRGTSGSVTGAPVTANGFVWYPVAMFGFGAGWTVGEYLAAGATAGAEPGEDPVDLGPPPAATEAPAPAGGTTGDPPTGQDPAPESSEPPSGS
jgi:uncharacterized protein YgiM (DUF1202 family)